MCRGFLLSLASLFACVSPSLAHYNMLLPASWSAKKDEPVTFTYQWGHPFEHQLFDAPAPEMVMVIAPDGKVSDHTKNMEKIALPTGDNKKVSAYQSGSRLICAGDYVIVLRCGRRQSGCRKMASFCRTSVKVELHVQAQYGWDHLHKQVFKDFEWTPLTRPYGLEPGMYFQAQIRRVEANKNGSSFRSPSRFVPLADAKVEVERYNEVSPRVLPPDEQITRVVKTDGETAYFVHAH